MTLARRYMPMPPRPLLSDELCIALPQDELISALHFTEASVSPSHGLEDPVVRPRVAVVHRQPRGLRVAHPVLRRVRVGYG